MSNAAGHTPLVMAVINGQTEMVKEFLTRTISKIEVDFEQVIKLGETEQTILSLLLHYPGLHPDLVLQGKDKTFLNSVDEDCNNILMRIAAEDSRKVLRGILKSKAATEEHVFDMSARNISGQNILHILAKNDDKFNVQMVLSLMEEPDRALDCMDYYDRTPLMLAYHRRCYGVADMIVKFICINKIRIDLSLKDSEGMTVNQQAEHSKKYRLEMEEGSVAETMEIRLRCMALRKKKKQQIEKEKMDKRREEKEQKERERQNWLAKE